MASSTRLPNLEQAILTYWPWENEKTWSPTWKQINILYIERFYIICYSYLQPLEDLASSPVTRRGDEGLENMAACRVCCQRQQVSGGQGAQTAEEQGAIVESGQRLDQPGAVIADRRQWDLEPHYGIKRC